jgi:hypothetical protein
VAAVVAVGETAAVVGWLIDDCVHPTSANMIAPRALATAGRRGTATARLGLTVCTFVDFLNSGGYRPAWFEVSLGTL